MFAFGPIPSRRLGQSLGINAIPPKRCSYGCGYCQVQAPTTMQVLRSDFAAAADVVAAVRRRVAECRAAGQRIDHLSFVPDGEPTLDAQLGEQIRALRPLGIPVAVITNGTLLWRSDVRRDLAGADLVSVKVDAVVEPAWRRVNRPAPALRLERVLAGIEDFARSYRGTLWTETLLVAGANDGEADVRATARFLERLAPACAWLSPPTRPPFEADVAAPSTAALVRAYAIMREHVARVELLGTESGAGFGAAGDAIEELLAILAIHPMEESAVSAWLAGSPAARGPLEALLANGGIERVGYAGTTFYTRRFASRGR
ncbi:MAG TPA: radical SAM protein [Longimicrobiales bacterium]|nr:radical SAM protein [Longimicrobiales bacterium]